MDTSSAAPPRQLGAPHDHLLHNYRRLPLTIVRGEGCELFDDTGTRYLDLVGGIAVCALGHAHPVITAAIAEQAATLVQASNLFHHEPAGQLANELAKRSGLERVFFCNSGAEANEAAFKLARKVAYRRGDQRRRTILSCTGSFHGRTLAAVTATANTAYQEGFDPLPGGFQTTPFNDLAALERDLTDEVAGFIVEPIQGESGVQPATLAYLQRARELCDQHGALLIFDEIQCGLGRLGTLFTFHTLGIRPDLVTIAKGLANGLPIGALLIDERHALGLQPGDHGTTFGGSPVPCAAALAHLRLRDDIDLDAHVLNVGAIFRGALEELATEYPTIFDQPRGSGLMLGLPVRSPMTAAEISKAAIAEHLLINAAGNNTLRIIPPLIITEREIITAMQRLRRTLASLPQVSTAETA